MRKRARRNHSRALKAKVALEAIRGQLAVTELAQRHDIHPNLITQWKAQLLDRATEAFSTPGERAEASMDVKTLHANLRHLR